jgi:hypothetical protein
MGYERAGFYSYALLDNAGHESPREVLDEFQDPQVGDSMPKAAQRARRPAHRQRRSIAASTSVSTMRPVRTSVLAACTIAR